LPECFSDKIVRGQAYRESIRARRVSPTYIEWLLNFYIPCRIIRLPFFIRVYSWFKR